MQRCSARGVRRAPSNDEAAASEAPRVLLLSAAALTGVPPRARQKRPSQKPCQRHVVHRARAAAPPPAAERAAPPWRRQSAAGRRMPLPPDAQRVARCRPPLDASNRAQVPLAPPWRCTGAPAPWRVAPWGSSRVSCARLRCHPPCTPMHASARICSRQPPQKAAAPPPWPGAARGEERRAQRQPRGRRMPPCLSSRRPTRCAAAGVRPPDGPPRAEPRTAHASLFLAASLGLRMARSACRSVGRWYKRASVAAQARGACEYSMPHGRCERAAGHLIGRSQRGDRELMRAARSRGNGAQRTSEAHGTAAGREGQELPPPPSSWLALRHPWRWRA
jgi:hypothetical protein